ncbi:MAG TPA: hypothetical protein EYP36_10685, partial [Calditrichaeota bacterium]|nr:hypothetical protein [Calditrichota bacterium]
MIKNNLIVFMSLLFLCVSYSQAQIIVNDNWIQQNNSEGALFFDQAGQTYRFETDFSAAGT